MEHEPFSFSEVGISFILIIEKFRHQKYHKKECQLPMILIGLQWIYQISERFIIFFFFLFYLINKKNLLYYFKYYFYGRKGIIDQKHKNVKIFSETIN